MAGDPATAPRIPDEHDGRMKEGLVIAEVDPRGGDALALLHEAAIEARALYADLFGGDTPWPINEPTPSRGAYLVAYFESRPVACGALRPLSDQSAEIRRMFVTRHARRSGVARALLRELETRAYALGFTTIRLETGNRQQAAMTLYAAAGFEQIAPFGDYVNDPVSVCFEKAIGKGSSGDLPR